MTEARKTVTIYRDMIAEGIHAGLRKATDHPKAGVAWHAISGLPNEDWSSVIEFALYGSTAADALTAALDRAELAERQRDYNAEVIEQRNVMLTALNSRFVDALEKVNKLEAELADPMRMMKLALFGLLQQEKKEASYIGVLCGYDAQGEKLFANMRFAVGPKEPDTNAEPRGACEFCNKLLDWADEHEMTAEGGVACQPCADYWRDMNDG